jgi:hypothetical protein
MADVYRGSYLTPAASSTSDSDGGLFLNSQTLAKVVHLFAQLFPPECQEKLQSPTNASLPFLDLDNTFDIRIGSENRQPPGLLLHLDGWKVNYDQDQMFLLRLFTANVKDSVADLDDFVLLPREESHNKTVFRRLSAGHLARPQPEPFILFSTTHLICLYEPMDEESLKKLFKSPEAPLAFF